MKATERLLSTIHGPTTGAQVADGEANDIRMDKIVYLAVTSGQ